MLPILAIPSYLAPVHFYARLAQSPSAILEQYAFYEKKTFRNRTVVSAANGPITLSIPVIKPRLDKTPDKDIQISYDTPWQATHWKTISSAYKSSPFFEYYGDDFEPFYRKKNKFLIDFNLQLMETACENIGLPCHISLTESYITDTTPYADIRPTVAPRLVIQDLDPQFKIEPYRQVFGERNGFSPNLSIIDLLFCKGPEAIEVLKRAIT